MKKSIKNKSKCANLKTLGFTLVELLAVIVILGVLALITFPIIDGTIKNSKEKALESTIKSIEDAAYNYSVKNDIGYQLYYKKITLEELSTAGLLEKEIIDPVTNNKMNGCVLYKWDEVYKQYEFKYDEECNIPSKPINEIIMNQFPYLVTDGTGCITQNDNNYSYLGGCYLKGNPNNNYIWYSGFLWRIMGINADGTIRMITDENVTAIPWGENTTGENWDDSYAKDWLNNYFYPRLKGNSIIKEQMWCSETTTDSASARTECINNLSTEKTKVGLISLDEYNLAGGTDSYLDIAQDQLTLTPYSSDYDWRIYYYGDAAYRSVGATIAIRPVINVDSTDYITGGNGTIGTTWNIETGPYIFNEEKTAEVTGKLNEKSTSGEYVMFAGKKYRIIGEDSNGNVKLILDGYYEENNKIFTMKYNETSTNLFSLTTGIGQKLNTDVLEWLVSSNDTENRNKLVTNYTWYQNNFAFGYDYEVSLKELNADKSIDATVGVISVGEMLSSQSSSILTKGYTLEKNYNNATTYWIMTSYANASIGWYGSKLGHVYYNDVSNLLGLRPVIVINSNVTIISGNGTWSNPYQI